MFSKFYPVFIFFHVPLFSVSFFTHFLNLSLTFSKLKCFLISCFHSLSIVGSTFENVHVSCLLSSVLPFRYNSWWAVSCWAVSLRLSPPEELCTLLPHSPSPKITLQVYPLHWTYFPWFSVGILLLGFKSSQTMFHLICAFCTLVTFSWHLVLISVPFKPRGSFFQAPLSFSNYTLIHRRLLQFSLRSSSPLFLNFWGHSWYHRYLNITYSPDCLLFYVYLFCDLPT